MEIFFITCRGWMFGEPKVLVLVGVERSMRIHFCLVHLP